MLNIHCFRWIDKSIDFSPPMAWIDNPGRATSVQNALDHYNFTGKKSEKPIFVGGNPPTVF
jgi:hypothetical protein